MSLDPISIISIVLIQIGSRHIKFDITNAQEEIIKHPITQIILFGCLIYVTTKDILTTIIVIIVSYLVIYVLLNENSQFNILSDNWLYNKKLTNIQNIVSYKEIYKNNLEIYHK